MNAMSKSDFDKMMINLWVAGNVDKQHNGGWCSQLHCVINGQEYSKFIGGYAKETTVTRMTLIGILNGLRALKKERAVFVNIYTTVVQVSSGLNKNMYKWATSNWLTTKGTPPQHMDLWKEIYDILNDDSRVITYRVFLQNAETRDSPNRLLTIHRSAEYLMLGKKDRYEVSLT
jgi:ribonuclease HI